MPAKVIRIERTKSRPGGTEQPRRTAEGKYVLGNPARGNKKHLAKYAICVSTLDEAAALIARGYSLWMTGPGKRASLISPGSLRVVRA
jgi:hypothetical protein